MVDVQSVKPSSTLQYKKTKDDIKTSVDSILTVLSPHIHIYDPLSFHIFFSSHKILQSSYIFAVSRRIYHISTHRRRHDFQVTGCKNDNVFIWFISDFQHMFFSVIFLLVTKVHISLLGPWGFFIVSGVLVLSCHNWAKLPFYYDYWFINANCFELHESVKCM